jgi:hypothetical protein
MEIAQSQVVEQPTAVRGLGLRKTLPDKLGKFKAGEAVKSNFTSSQGSETCDSESRKSNNEPPTHGA